LITKLRNTLLPAFAAVALFLAILGAAPSQSATKGGHFKLNFHWHDGVGTSVTYEAVEADGRLLRSKVPAGRHTFNLMVTFSRVIVQYRVFVNVEATLNPNADYQVEGNIEKKTVSAWIVDAAGKRVSTIGKVSYHHCPFWPVCTE
jgi:hypothetical protein